jgi:hypothetical protein
MPCTKKRNGNNSVPLYGVPGMGDNSRVKVPNAP